MPTLPWRRRSDGQNIESDPAPPIAPATAVTRSRLGARALSAALLGCVALSPIALLASAAAWTHDGSAAATATTASPADHSDAQAAAGEFAEQVVVAWLQATSAHPEELQALVPSAVVPAGVTTAFRVADPAVAGIRAQGSGWSVTVAATVTDAAKTTVRRYYRLPVTVTGQTVTAAMLPTPVAAPTVASPPADAYDTTVEPGSPAAIAVAQFLAAYLTGAGDVSRYLTPGAAVTPPTPPAYTAIHLDDLAATTDTDPAAVPGDGAGLSVLATVTASVSDAQAATTQIALTLTARAGRWEITALDPAPAPTSQP